MNIKEKFKHFQMATFFVHPSVLYHFLCYTYNNYRIGLSSWVILIEYISLTSLEVPSAEILVDNLYVKYATELWLRTDTHTHGTLTVVAEMYNYENDYVGLRTSRMQNEMIGTRLIQVSVSKISLEMLSKP